MVLQRALQARKKGEWQHRSGMHSRCGSAAYPAPSGVLGLGERKISSAPRPKQGAGTQPHLRAAGEHTALQAQQGVPAAQRRTLSSMWRSTWPTVLKE